MTRIGLTVLVTRLGKVMTRFEKFLDDSDLKSLRLWLNENESGTSLAEILQQAIPWIIVDWHAYTPLFFTYFLSRLFEAFC